MKFGLLLGSLTLSALTTFTAEASPKHLPMLKCNSLPSGGSVEFFQDPPSVASSHWPILAVRDIQDFDFVDFGLGLLAVKHFGNSTIFVYDEEREALSRKGLSFSIEIDNNLLLSGGRGPVRVRGALARWSSSSDKLLVKNIDETTECEAIRSIVPPQL